MQGFLATRKKFVLLVALVVVGVTAIAAYAALPSRTVPPASVPLGALAGKTAVNCFRLTHSHGRSIKHKGRTPSCSTSRSPPGSRRSGTPIPARTSSSLSVAA